MRHATWLIALLGSWCSLSASGGAVATVDPLATDAAMAAMKKGGNAVDGAVAAGLTLGVVNGYNSGIGGGCFMVIRLANGKFVVIDGREMAPAAARRDMYLKEGKALMTALCKARFKAFGTAGHASRITPVPLEAMARRY